MKADSKASSDQLSSTPYFRIHGVFESIYANIFFILAILTIFTTIGIIYFLFKDALVFFSQYSPIQFLTSSNWSPVIPPESYGILPLLFVCLIL